MRSTACVAGFEPDAPWLMPGSPRPAARRHRAHAGRDLVEIERLDDVVVGARVEAADAILHVVARGEDDDRSGIAAMTQLTQHLDSISPRQPEIQ